jgi:hypothetical protein
LETQLRENVNRHTAVGRDLKSGEKVETLVHEFKPQTGERMLIACLWSRWSGHGQPDLLSFAAITDEPPPPSDGIHHSSDGIALPRW